jgi:hypothetical protein
VKSLACVATLLAMGVSLVGCGKEAPAGPGASDDTTAISGALAATDGRTGRLTLASATTAVADALGGPELAVSAAVGVINLTGTVSLSDGTSATLTGTWDTDMGALSVSGGGFTFSGTMENGVLTGSFAGPSITGLFSLQVGGSSDLAVYCGVFTGRQSEDLPDGGSGTAPSNGTWNLVVGASTVQLIGIAGQEKDPIVLAGTRSGNTVTISVPGGSATGTIRGTDGEFVNGTYSTAEGEQGTFHGSQAACTAASETGALAQLVINPPGLLPGNGRLAFDSTLTFVTALDADGNLVAAPELTWDFPANDQFIRTNGEPVLPGQQWVVLQSPQGAGTGTPPQLVTRTFSVTSHNHPTVTATGTVVIYWYW